MPIMNKSGVIRDMIVSPPIIFLAVWSMQVIGHTLLQRDFDKFSDHTWWLLAAATFSFILGCAFVTFTYIGCRRPNRGITPSKLRGGKRAFWILLAAYGVFGLAPIINILLDHDSISGARDAIVKGIESRNDSIVRSYYFSALLVVFAVYLISQASHYSSGFLVIGFVAATVAAISSSGRTLLLLLFTSTPVSLYLQDKIRKKTFFASFLVFLCFFLALAVLNGKGAFINDPYSQIAWNLKVYVLNGLASFNHFVTNNHPRFDGNILVPNLLRRIFELEGDAIPLVLPFVETPFPGNVYTALYPWHHDGGALGLMAGFFLIGAFSQYFYHARHKSFKHTFYYSISAYALIMTIFQDQYIQAYPSMDDGNPVSIPGIRTSPKDAQAFHY